MKPNDVKYAALLLEQHDKLKAFLRDAPSGADTMTITFRKGSKSKSLTLKDDPTIVQIRDIVENIEEKTHHILLEMGVHMENGEMAER